MDDKEIMRRAIDIEMGHLLATFEPRHYGTAKEVKLAWLMATAKYDATVVMEAVGRFLSGKVDEYDPAVLPTAPELARECQAIVWEREAQGFDIGAAMADAIAKDSDIQRQAEMSRRMSETAEAVEGADNVTPLRRPASQQPQGAA